MNYATNKVTFGDRKRWYWFIMSQNMGQNEVIFGTGEVDIGSLQDELWDITMWHFGTGEVDFLS